MDYAEDLVDLKHWERVAWIESLGGHKQVKLASKIIITWNIIAPVNMVLCVFAEDIESKDKYINME